jgi:hypothetical protein
MFKFISKYSFVIVTVINSAISFGKSYLFMDLLNKDSLGYLAIFQSVIVIVSFFQIGVLHGGYRIISFSVERKNFTNAVVSNFLLFLSFLSVCCLIFYSSIWEFSWFIVTAVFVGLISLWASWFTNLYLGLGKSKQLSNMIFFSIIFSLFFIPFLYWYGIFGAVLIISMQPLSFVILSLVLNKDFRFSYDLKSLFKIKMLANYGFIPFLTGVLYLANMQLERFVIGADLGVTSLGDYYLVFVYTSIFMVGPSALGMLNFPPLMKELRSNKNKSFFSVFKVYYIELLAYISLVILLTLFVLPSIIEVYLPSHIQGIKYVNIIFIGLILYCLIDPISFLINARLDYKQLITIYIYAIIISLASYAFIFYSRIGSLIYYSYVNLLFFISLFLGYIVYIIFNGMNKKKIAKIV